MKRKERGRPCRSFREAAQWLFEDLQQDERTELLQAAAEAEASATNETDRALRAFEKKNLEKFFADHPPT